MIIATGRTWEHRDRLREMGGSYNVALKRWEFDYLDTADRVRISVMVGVMLTDIPALSTWIEPKPTLMFGDDHTYFNYFADRDPTAFFGFSSLDAMIDYVEALEPPEKTEHTSDSAWLVSEKRTKFTGTESMQEAIRIARDGWTDGLGIASMLDIEQPQGKRRAPSIAGGSVSIGRLLSGNPKHMLSRKRLPAHRSIRLFVGTGMPATVGATIAIYRALLIGAMIDALETEGYRCEIITVDCCEHTDTHLPKSQIVVTLKAANERLNILNLMFALGHPSYLRRFAFAILGSVPECNHNELDSVHYGSDAFTADYPCKPGEFHIRELTMVDGIKLEKSGRMMDILPMIEPDGLPVKLKIRD